MPTSFRLRPGPNLPSYTSRPLHPTAYSVCFLLNDCRLHYSLPPNARTHASMPANSCTSLHLPKGRKLPWVASKRVPFSETTSTFNTKDAGTVHLQFGATHCQGHGCHVVEPGAEEKFTDAATVPDAYHVLRTPHVPPISPVLARTHPTTLADFLVLLPRIWKKKSQQAPPT